MSAPARIHWIRIILGALLVEVVLGVVLIPISFVNETAFLVAVPIGCVVLPYLITRWVLRSVSRPVLHGALVGVVATVMYLGLVFASPDGLSGAVAIYGVLLFWIVNALRIVGCVLGGVHAGRGTPAGAAVVVGLVIAVTAGGHYPAVAQQPACLHGPGETDAERVRRQQAVGLTRDINTRQAMAFSANGRYQAIESLALTAPVPQGFAVHLATDGRRYAFSVKDTLDPCAFAYFSDEGGRIYVGEGLR